MENNRAVKGGQIGMNGLHYDGGQFLPSTELGKMTKTQIKAQKVADSKAQAAEFSRKNTAAYKIYQNDPRLQANGHYRIFEAGNLAKIDGIWETL